MKLIKNTLKYFDFYKVYATMEALDWKYWHTTSTPDIEVLKKTAKSLLKAAVDDAHATKRSMTVGSGGFEAYAHYDKREDQIDYVSLKFVVTDWSESVNEG